MNKSIDKLAAVDSRFAVSATDLALAIERVGTSAKDAGVGFNELLAVVTSAQQITARGGAVIGNAFKTIFVRLEKPEIILDLEKLGIKIKKSKNAINTLKSIVKQYDKLPKTNQYKVSELIGGLFHITIARAALSDIGKQDGVYNQALKSANKALAK